MNCPDCPELDYLPRDQVRLRCCLDTVAEREAAREAARLDPGPRVYDQNGKRLNRAERRRLARNRP